MAFFQERKPDYIVNVYRDSKGKYAVWIDNEILVKRFDTEKEANIYARGMVDGAFRMNGKYLALGSGG